jgi:hypothetical protein
MRCEIGAQKGRLTTRRPSVADEHHPMRQDAGSAQGAWVGHRNQEGSFNSEAETGYEGEVSSERSMRAK